MTLLEMALAGLNELLSIYKAKGVPAEAVGYIEAAIGNLLQAHAKELTFENIESLRVKVPVWDK